MNSLSHYEMQKKKYEIEQIVEHRDKQINIQAHSPWYLS